MAAELRVRDAKRRQDEHELLVFRCWRENAEEEYVREVDEYVRRYALATAHKTLLFYDDRNELVGVTAFDREDIPLVGRRRVAGWRFQAAALAPSWRGRWMDADIEGCSSSMKASEFLLRATYRRMLDLDKRRVLVVGRVHDDNRASMRACERVGLVRTEREDDDYWRLLGEVDPAAQPLR